MSDPANSLFSKSFLEALAKRAGEKAVEQHVEEEKHFRSVGDQAGTASSLEAQALSLSNLGSYKSALERLQEAQEILAYLDDTPRLTWNLRCQADLLEQMGNQSAAESLRNQAQPLLKKSLEMQVSLAQRGLDLKSRGEFETALRVHGEEETICRSLGLRSALARCVANQAVIYLHLQNADQAVSLFEQAREIFEAAKDLSGLAQTLENLGAVESQRGNPGGAAEHYGAAAERYQAVPAEVDAARCTYEQAAALAKAERFPEALRLVESAETLCRRQGNPGNLANCLLAKYCVLSSANRFDLALEVSRELEAIHRKLHDLNWAARDMATQAVCLKVLGRNGEARQRCQEAYDLARELNSEDVSGIHNILQSIPPPGMREKFRSALGFRARR